MTPLIFGAWDGVFYDNRSTFSPSAPEGLDINQFSQFNPGNPVMSFVCDRGFLVLDRRASLVFSLWRYYEAANVRRVALVPRLLLKHLKVPSRGRPPQSIGTLLRKWPSK